MLPDQHKIEAIQGWPQPTDAPAIRQFLGLASYYRRYIPNFSNVAAPLTKLSQKRVQYSWNTKCEDAFQLLKSKLSQSPILAYPKIGWDESPFILQTDASNIGLGAVLEQEGKVIAYASRTLTKSECNYSVIQKECLAIIFALKQFRHYLLGRKFQLMTDHAPLQWLSAQKMQGMLCRWALAMQEFDFEISYRKGILNGNADALSRRGTRDMSMTEDTTAATVLTQPYDVLREAQQKDDIIKTILHALSVSKSCPTAKEWNSRPLHRYKQLWPQLLLVEGVVCRRYTPGPTSTTVTVPILPMSLRKEALQHNHDHPSAGHLGVDKTLQRILKEAYWVYMASDVTKYCHECTRCQQVKPSKPTRAPLTSVPIGRVWQMIAVDVLEVPLSLNNNRYLLVIQDYFTKWAEAIPMPDQTAARITTELVKLFSQTGIAL